MAGITRQLGRCRSTWAGPGLRSRHLQGTAQPLSHRNPGLRIGHVPNNLIDEMLIGVAALGTEQAPLIAVGVEVDNTLGFQLIGMGLSPLRRAQQHRLFGVPAQIDQGPLGLVTGLSQLADRLSLGQQRHLAAERVGGTKNPPIPVIAAHHPLVRRLRPLHHRDHIIDGLQAPFRLHRQMHLGLLVPAHVIGDRQAADPVLRHRIAAQGAQEMLRIAIRDRQHRDLEDGLRVLPL